MLADRVETLEKTVRELQGQLRAAEGRVQSASRLARAVGGGGLVAVSLAVTLGLAAPGQSQAQPGAKPLAVKAPFVVLGAGGKRIFEVGEFGDQHGARVNGADGKAVATLYGHAGGGSVTAWADDGRYQASLLGSTTRPGFYLAQGQDQEIGLGIGPDGNARLVVYGKTSIAAAIGADPKEGKGVVELHSSAGTLGVKLAAAADGGNLRIFDAGGTNRASVFANGGGGIVAVHNTGGSGVAQLSEEKGAGRFHLANADGEERVQAYVTQGGLGAVVALPRTPKPPALVTPQYILGGEAK
jgi:hypothetical protein